ncbi:hypothetical protein DOTSEDRAFT_67901 [Dothistroma septosporum NZE10]|uniref:Plasma membrane fusion protein PRM1 n=1 Tax=Dothistroma septosporum (strain NZE10 / CBS 128990) TaxID=675120 RepID=N1Q2X7_DOTSN|nr:hypothetical protein DOTSEDRAFT_67901 [Dothistroma septosporum NZE10]
MAPSENQQQTPNPAPPSLSAGGYETRDYCAAQPATRPTSQYEPYLTPYLGLRARLSQTWINRWTILLLLVLIRTLFAITSIDNNLGTARKQALSACTSAENVGSAMASMPHYMSQGVNELSAKGIEKAVNGLMHMLVLTLTGVEEIVVFIINLITSTYVCLLTLAIRGGLHIAIEVAEQIGDFVNATTKEVGDDLGKVASDFQNAMNGFLSGIDKLGDYLTGHDDKKAPTIDLTSEINKLKDLEIPSGYDEGLQNLNNSIPTFAEVQNLTNTAIRFPFEELKKLVNESLPRYSMEGSMFPVPAKERLSFCSDNDGVSDFFDGLVSIEHKAKTIFLCLFVALAILAMFPMASREYRAWHKMQDRAQLIKSDAYDAQDAVYIVSRPHTSSFGLWLAKIWSSKRRRVLVRWTVAHATTVPALFVLSLAVAGLLGCACQYTLLKTLEKQVPALEYQVADFADKVVISLNNASEQWAMGTNNIITDTSTSVNHDVFGWVNTSTSAVNDTLNTFVNEMIDGLNATFGGTVLYEPIKEVLDCLLFLKIVGIQKGLDWVSDNARINIPLLPNDTLTLGIAQKLTNSSTDLLATGEDGAADNAIEDIVDRLIQAFAAGIRQEAIISACLLLIWATIVLTGLARAVYLLFKGGKYGLFPEPTPTGRMSPRQAKYELDPFPSHVQATPSADQESSRGNKWQDRQYTLTPNPLPILHNGNTTSPIVPADQSPLNEKMGTVSGQNVDSAIRRPTPSQTRASRHGDYAVTSPIRQINPFLSADEAKNSHQNPFMDPGR